MRKLKIFEHISLDGIIQAPGGRNEDGNYPYGGWAGTYGDPEAGKAILAAHSKPFDLLLGRRTYDIWAGYWPTATNPFADNINAATKYVVTRRPESLEWAPFEDLGLDIVRGIRRVMAKDGPELIVWGSSTLTPILLQHGLADEVMLIIYPVLLGLGKRFFSEGTPPQTLTLAGTKAMASGVTINTYTPAGPLRTGS